MAGDNGKCHQRKIRDEMCLIDPREAEKSLLGFYIEEVSKEEAKEIILKYEWLGTMPMATMFCYGLFSPGKELQGVACFGKGNGTNASKITTSEIANPICLERGACVHYSHPHAPSFLVSGACRKAYQDKKYNVFYAYSDSEAGEIGTIYQACNWTYLGVAPGRASKYRHKYKHKESGEFVSSRSMRLRAKKAGMTLADFTREDWERVKDLGKGKYCWFEGSKSMKKKLKRGLRYPSIIYPKRVVKD